jgi:hypothetical protein
MTAPWNEEERLRRWRLVLGSEAQASCGALNARATLKPLDLRPSERVKP